MTTDTDDFTSSSAFVKSQLTKKLCAFGDCLDAAMICIIAPMQYGVDDVVRDAIENLKSTSGRLVVLLETAGGSIEVVEKLVGVFRTHYPDDVSFIIPSFAMSAGTVLAMSGDAIYMDYYSVMGPIDPQIKSISKDDRWVPALGYLAKYEELVEKSARGQLSTAELAFLIQKFDPAELHQYEKARELSIELLKKWLVKYKFKNWKITRDRYLPVTHEMKEARAEEIATELNKTETWKTHGRGISMKTFNEDLNLLIDDFGAKSELNTKIRSYYRLLKDYMNQVQHGIVVHTPESYMGV